MSVTPFIQTSDDIGTWFHATNNLISHVQNADTYVLVGNTATGNVGLEGTLSVRHLLANGNVTLSGTGLFNVSTANTLFSGTEVLISANTNITGNATFMKTHHYDVAQFSNALQVSVVDVAPTVVTSNGSLPATSLFRVRRTSNTAGTWRNTVVDASLDHQTLLSGNTDIRSLQVYATVGNATSTVNTNAIVTGAHILARDIRTNTTTLSGLVGANVMVTVADANTSLVKGIVGTISPIANGHITTAIALHGRVVTNATANTYVLSTINGMLSESNFGAPLGVVYNWYGSRITLTNEGTIGNTYGLHIGDISSGTQTNAPWAIYQTDQNARNYFAGNLGVGNTAPTHALRVEGTTSLNGSLAVTTSVAVSGAATFAGTATVAGTVTASGALIVGTGMVVPVGADKWVSL